ncbi:MAG: glycosyltransferase family A protein [Alistipes sp.]
MKWYEKQLSVYERPFDEAPQQILDQVKARLTAMQSPEPVASVVLIAHNEESRLLSCLWSLSENVTSYPIEIFVVDNLSTDRTAQVAEALGVRCIREPKKGAGHARQCGLDHARGRYYLAIDSDSLYPPHYIDISIGALEHKDVVCCYAMLSFLNAGEQSRLGIWFYELLRDCYLRLRNIKRPELCVRGSCMSFRVAEGRKAGGFRTNIRRGEDGSLALKLKKCGRLQLITSRKARVITNDPSITRGDSLMRRLAQQASRASKNATTLFTTKRHYKDDASNLLK